MRSVHLLRSLALLPLLCLLPVRAQEAAPRIERVGSLTFGGLLVQSGGRVVLTAEGSLLPEGQGVQRGATPSAIPARLRLQGPPLRSWRLRLEPVRLDLQGPGGVLPLLDLRSSKTEGTFDVNGEAEVRVGGTLEVPGGALPGLYTSTQACAQMEVQGLAEGVTCFFPVSALLRCPLLLENTSPLDFGGLLPGLVSSPFRLLPTGSVAPGDAMGARLIQGRAHPAAFHLRGPAHTSYTILLPREISLVGPGTPMICRDFSLDVAPSGTLPEGGLNFRVGATLQVEPEQGGGTYRGSFQVMVVYP